METGTYHEEGVHLHDSHIKANAAIQTRPVDGCDVKMTEHPLGAIEEVAVRDSYALGSASGPGGKDHVGDVFLCGK